jgi:tRNA(Phe) wybutosine-synthesizing methylase Tyw3
MTEWIKFGSSIIRVSGIKSIKINEEKYNIEICYYEDIGTRISNENRFSIKEYFLTLTEVNERLEKILNLLNGEK